MKKGGPEREREREISLYFFEVAFSFHGNAEMSVALLLHVHHTTQWPFIPFTGTEILQSITLFQLATKIECHACRRGPTNWKLESSHFQLMWTHLIRSTALIQTAEILGLIYNINKMSLNNQNLKSHTLFHDFNDELTESSLWCIQHLDQQPQRYKSVLSLYSIFLIFQIRKNFSIHIEDGGGYITCVIVSRWRRQNPQTF